jgi:hypothetical protein
MRTTAKLGALIATGALVIAVPAAAKTHPAHPAHPATHSGKAHKCTAHKVAYIVFGNFVSWSVTATGNGRYSGTITLDVKRTNHHAKGDKGATNKTYSLNDTRVRFGDGANPPAAGDLVKLIGKITVVGKKCSDQTAAGTITVRKLDISVPKHTK